jgi:GTPase
MLRGRTLNAAKAVIETIYGNLQGLKANQIKQLQRLYHQRLPGSHLLTPEFAQRLAALSTEIEQPVSCYLNRRGQVIRVGVGSVRQTQMPLLELPRYGGGRLSGIRCLTTGFGAQPPDNADLTAMALQRLDALVCLSLSGAGFQRRGGGGTGYVESAYLAHLIPPDPTPWQIAGPQELDQVAAQDLLRLVGELEADLAAHQATLTTRTDGEQVLLIGLQTGRKTSQDLEDGLAELTRLVESAGGNVLDALRQKRTQPHPQTVVGAGKVQEIALRAQTLGANLVVFDRDLSPAQTRNLEAQIGVKILDRTEIILDIFAQRAQSQAGKLQVELAQLEYLLPRLTGKGRALSRLGGGIGTRGPGETKLETERRAIQRRITHLQQSVNQLQSHRARMRQRRQHQQVPAIAVVGYTNAGKSTLLNVLTQSDVYAADQLFATLDPTTRRLTVVEEGTHRSETVLLVDTVGFIHELPPPLMDAFRATLEEVTEAEALLHVVDLSHPAWLSQVRSVMQILSEMPVTPGPVLLAFNKIDVADSEALATAQEEFPQALFISAGQRLGLSTLRQRLLQLVHYAVAV